MNKSNSTIQLLRSDLIRLLKTRTRLESDEINAAIRNILDAELFGKKSHGLHSLNYILESNTETNRVTEPIHIEKVSDSVTTVSGGNKIGSAAMYKAISVIKRDRTVDKIRLYCFSNLKPSIGYLGSYTRRLAMDGNIGILVSNTNGTILIHPTQDACLGTTPISISIPYFKSPIVFDMASSEISWSELDRLFLLGNQEANKIAGFTRYKKETRNLNEILGGGSLKNFGGIKGIALNLMLELIVGILTNTLNIKDQFSWGAVLIVINKNHLDYESINEFINNLGINSDSYLRLPGEKRNKSITLSNDGLLTLSNLSVKYNFNFYTLNHVK